MHLSHLKLYQYRNLEDGALGFSPGVNLVVGPNGQGKTNLIEALHLLSEGRSFRGGKNNELARWGKGKASVFGTVVARTGDAELGVVFEQKQRQCFLNGNRCLAPQFVGRLLCVTFSPTDLALVQGAPQQRRSFIDRHAAAMNPLFMQALLNYQRALRSKILLLKSGKCTLTHLDPWNQIMAKEAALITTTRLRELAKVEFGAAKLHQQYAPDDGILEIHLQGSTSAEGKSKDVEQIYNDLTEHSKREIAYERCLYGPHRDDLVIRLSGHPARQFASQGQSRSIVLSLKLALMDLLEEHALEPPVVLLDDVDSELDQGRSRYFFDLLFGSERQIFITATEPERLGTSMIHAGKTFYVMDGKITSTP